MTGSGERLPITVSIIARDEERDLPAAIESVPFASEVVVVVDAASTDHTAQLARSLDRPDRPVKVIERPWAGHVAQKSFALAQASSEWVLCLDADERVSPELRGEIERLFLGRPGGPAGDGFTVCRRTSYLGRWMVGGGWYPDRKLRLARRSLARWEGVDPHDRLTVSGRVEPLGGDLLHLSCRDLSDHLRKLDLFTGIAARGKRSRSVGLPALRMLVHPPARFLKMLLVRGGWRDGMPGLIAAGMGALYAFLKYAKLWEIYGAERRRPRSPPRGQPARQPAGSAAEGLPPDGAGVGGAP